MAATSSKGIIEARELEIPIINVENRIDYILKRIEELVSIHQGTRGPFYLDLEKMRKSMKEIEVQWTADVNGMEAAAKAGNSREAKRYETLAILAEQNYALIVGMVLDKVLENMKSSKIPLEEKKIAMQLLSDVKKRRALAQRVKIALLKSI
jgi:hypothetical protein